eukprot:13035014-Ditylum_brightwellii.AAC.1
MQHQVYASPWVIIDILSACWSLMRFDKRNIITLDCSTCVEMDVSTLDVLGDMNIIRHLKFPNNFHGTMTTLFITMQGKITMSSIKLKTDTTGVLSGLNIVLMGNSEVNFYLHRENATVCQSVMGKASPPNCENIQEPIVK